MYGTSVVIDLTFPLLGYLKFDTLLYVWDQYILGLNVPGFSAEWMAVVIATVLGLEHDKLKECQSPLAMETVLNRDSPLLTVQQFQFQVKRYHYRELFAMLTADQKSAMPVLDPTQ
uniref:Rab-GAP TBC domain-containing protein n=1 Tax=Biomphalaria glabrata TaxID=6526 RepID=A0A2C9KS74_BIOGL